jgi:hypothetical protein
MLVARFRTARHAVFVVSDLTATENVTIAQKLSPAIADISSNRNGVVKDKLLKSIYGEIKGDCMAKQLEKKTSACRSLAALDKFPAFNSYDLERNFDLLG